MAKLIIVNAFSLSMLPENAGGMTVRVSPPGDAAWARQQVETAATFGIEVESAVGHESTAALFSLDLGRYVEAKRARVTLGPGTILLVGQYSGPRLDEGVTELPPGAVIVWLTVTAQYCDPMECLK